MRLIERYMFWRMTWAFALTIGVLIAVVWSTQALRRMDLVTAHGQTIWFFLEMTLLALPSLAIVVAPFAILIGMITVLSTMLADSELVVISAAGGPRWVILRPFLVFAVIIAIAMGVLSTEVGPIGRKWMREMLTQVRADVIANVLQPGRFTEIDDGLTFHVSARNADGSLVGIMLTDDRDPKITFTYLARQGQLTEMFDRTLLVMREGTIQRRIGGGSLSIVAFESYAFDLTHLTGNDTQPTFKTTERGILDLINPDPADPYYQKVPGRFRAEIHDRLVQPLFPIAFVLIAFVFLGDPKTIRQGQGLSALSAIIGCMAVRAGSFSAVNLSAKSATMVPVIYLFPVAAIVVALVLIRSDRRVGVPDKISRYLERTLENWRARFEKSRFGSDSAGSA